MMRCLTTEQKILHQQYARLGEKIFKDSELENDLLNSTIWRSLAKEGLWALPIASEYGGNGLSWQDCVVALDGFFSVYSNTELLARFISQISSLYLISQYGTSAIKEHYLPRIIEGEMTRLVISKEIHPLLPCDTYLYIKKNKISHLRNNKIRIHVRKIKNEIMFFLNEKKLNLPTNNMDKSDLSITKSRGLIALCDLINFERLFYGILSANVVGRFIKNNNQHFLNTCVELNS